LFYGEAFNHVLPIGVFSFEDQPLDPMHLERLCRLDSRRSCSWGIVPAW
jgi:hypothetical protein